MEQFASNDDLLHCLGANIKSTQLLYALCLTSKLFNACFTPFLYRSVATYSVYYGSQRDSDIERVDEEGAKWDGSDGTTNSVPHCEVCDDRWPPRGPAYDINIDRNPNVRHVRELKVGFGDTFDDTRNLEIVDRLLSKIPSLEHLEVTTAGDVHLLHLIAFKYPRLKSLSFECEDPLQEQGQEPFFPSKLIGPEPALNFGTFTKLTSLSLTEIRTDGAVSGQNVVAMLLAAPQLRELRLDCWLNVWDAGEINERWNPLNFISDLCESYEERGGKPLKLRRLQLGSQTQLHSMKRRYQIAGALGELDRVLAIPVGGISPYHDHPAALYLEKLTNLSALEELSVDNYRHSTDFSNRNYSFMRILAQGFAWETFNKERAPRLRRIWVTQLDDDVFKWIQEHVAVSHGYGGQITISYGSQTTRCGIVSGLLRQGWRPKELQVDLDYDNYSQKQAIDHIVACGSQLEGLTLVPFLSETDQECKVYGELIAQLPRLKVFRLRRVVFEPSALNQWDLQTSFSEPDVVLLTNLVRQSSALRYIMVGAFAWSVVRNQDGRPVKLVGMSSSEWEDVELFRPHPFLHLYDAQKTVPSKGYKGYQPVHYSPRRPRDLILPRFDRPRRSNAKYA